jgi:hypothetical protein
VSAVAVHDEETHATVFHLISSGQVRLCAEAITTMMEVFASADAAASAPERTQIMSPDPAAITWGEGLAALRTLGISTCLQGVSALVRG